MAGDQRQTFSMRSSGHIEMTVVLMPDAYAALQRTAEAEGLEIVDVVNVAIMALEPIAAAARAVGKPVSEAMAEELNRDQ